MGEQALAATDVVKPSVSEAGAILGADTLENNKIRHTKLMSWYRQELQRQCANRYQMAKDEDYYDSLQHTDEEAKTLLARGQMPVAWNEAKPTIDWLLGTERRTRTDFEVIARNDDSPEAVEDAKVKTHLLKYLADANRTPFERSQAFNMCVKGGLAYIETGLSSDPDKEPIYTRAESWRYCLYDSLSSRLDLDDSRYFFRFKQVDTDVAKAYFPDKGTLIDAASTAMQEESYLKYYNGQRVETGGGGGGVSLPEQWTFYDSSAWADNPRQRVMLIEAWHREPVTENGRTYMKMRLTVMTEFDVILTGWSPYKHNRFPFIPMWCYRRSRDNAPYGVMRALRGPSDALNKSMSKAVFEASANQTLLESTAIDPLVMSADDLRDELAAPDGFGLLAPGGLNKIKIVDRTSRIDGQVKIAERALLNIRNAGGVTGENLGQQTANTSGKAIGLKQDQGSVATAEIFDNQLLCQQMEGEITLSLIEQFYTEQKIFSITGERGRREYRHINTPQPDGSLLNDITQRHAQYVIGEQPWRQTLMAAAFESMLTLLGQLATISPKVVDAMIADVLELGDFMNKKRMVGNVRRALGQSDPDAPDDGSEERAQEQQRQMAQRQFETEMAKLDAEIKASIAKGEQMDANALQLRVRAMYEALQAAHVVAAVPGVAPIADIILKGSGYVDRMGVDPNIPPAQIAPAAIAAPAPIPRPPNMNPATIPLPTDPAGPAPDLRPAAGDGAARGIETLRNDGAAPPV